MKKCACGNTTFTSYRVTESHIHIDGNGQEIGFNDPGNDHTYIDYNDQPECSKCGKEYLNFDAIPGEIDPGSTLELKD